MVCLFCNCDYHSTLNCTKFVTTKERKNSPNAKRFCFTCEVESNIAHENCNEECSDQYSLNHHILFCKERVKAFTLFLPKIDHNLLSRFGDLFQIDETYSMLLSSPPSAFKSVNLPKIKLSKEFDISYNSYPSETVAIIKDLNASKASDGIMKTFFDSINSKVILCFPRKIHISKSNLSPQMVLQLLSPYTKSFTFDDSTCTPNLNFTDIIKNAPNIEDITIYDLETNIQIDKTWPEDLLKYKKGNNFRSLNLKFGVIEKFNIETLREFILAKCTKNVGITISYDQRLIGDGNRKDCDRFWTKFHKIADKLFECMNDDRKGKYEETNPFITVVMDACDGYEIISLVNCFKTRNQPFRAAKTKNKYF